MHRIEDIEKEHLKSLQIKKKLPNNTDQSIPLELTSISLILPILSFSIISF